MIDFSFEKRKNLTFNPIVTAYKLYCAILKKKIQPIAETILNEEQCGFR
jgi:hypothetical protein